MSELAVQRPNVARACLILAAVLWSTGSLFMRLLREPTRLELETPQLDPILIAFYRGLFAGLIMVPMLKRTDCRFRPAMLIMIGCFSAMSGLYLSALGLGSAANAIFLQNTAPVWVCLIGVFILGHKADRKTWQSVLLGLFGASLLVCGNWPWGKGLEIYQREAGILMMGVGSGFMYAWVILFFGMLRAESSVWLTVLNLVGSGCVLGTVMALSLGWEGFCQWAGTPTTKQLLFLLLFGGVQMAIPYWLFARGVRAVGPQEAGLITLLEPVLNPVWAYMIAPDKEVPTYWTIAGGGFLLFALAWRYIPAKKRATLATT